MRLNRLEVSGGFLDGLRLSFADGLNVLIGPRGAGKTSVLELTRFALGVEAMTAEADQDAEKQARAVLADGTVSLFCGVQDQELVFTRTGLDEAPVMSASFSYDAPLIISQSEIEAIGLDPASRREILDRLLDPLTWSAIRLGDERPTVASLERRLERLRRGRDGLLEQGARLEGLEEGLKEAEREQSAAAQKVEAAKPLQEAIARRADQLGQVRSAADAYRIADETLDEWRRELSESRLHRPIPKLPSADVEEEVKAAIAQARSLIDQALKDIEGAQVLLTSSRTVTISQQSEIQAVLKTDAEKLEALQKGAGEIGRRVSGLRQQLKERQGLTARVAELDAEIASVIAERDLALDEGDARADARYQLRKERAASLTSEFNGKIEVRVYKSGEFGAYESALTSALQGSNLQYKALATEIASKMSPRELVSAVEAGDASRVEAAARISSDRAVRLVAHLEQSSFADLLLAPLEDAVDFALLDGQDYKPTKDLSMGQRCTVVLPLLLAEERDAVLLDQPEDHLDNAFIVDTLVEAIGERARGGQVIVATHNANIPVLGEAQQVVVMASDGRHGFVQTVAPLDDDAAVDAITTLMEGGRAAFARRAEFYKKHDHGQ